MSSYLNAHSSCSLMLFLLPRGSRFSEDPYCSLKLTREPNSPRFALPVPLYTLTVLLPPCPRVCIFSTTDTWSTVGPRYPCRSFIFVPQTIHEVYTRMARLFGLSESDKCDTMLWHVLGPRALVSGFQEQSSILGATESLSSRISCLSCSLFANHILL